jgi:thiamine pyrophosphate-dependent acetolactate synthase large subunit-like protein
MGLPPQERCRRAWRMSETERPRLPNAAPAMGWGSDVVAELLRRLDFPYITLNPGASYRGLHDSLVNYLGNQAPKMLLCLNEDHVVSIAHGYAKVTDKPMACVLHSNVGLMHGLMGIFNAWCDRMPMMVLGATGPVASEKRRPWIDWIHTAKDQGALLRDFTKWDDEPRSREAIIEGFFRGLQLTSTLPRAPVYICLDAGLQEQQFSDPVAIPDPRRYAVAPPPVAAADSVKAVAELMRAAKKPLLLFGRGSRDANDWARRIRLAELTGASVMTSMRERAVFPTDHPLHAVPPGYWLSQPAKDLVNSADFILSLDWVDFNGLLLQVARQTGEITAKIAHVSLDSVLHRGWSMDHFALPPVDMPVFADADAFVGQLLQALEQGMAGKCWQGENRNTTPAPVYSENSTNEVAPRDVEVALSKLRGGQAWSLAHVTLGWAGDAYHFTQPLDFLGHDGGAGLAAGPGLTVGVALALKGSGRAVVSVLGDGDMLQGITALWTAAHYEIPALFIVSNNRSHFNDEIHQEAVARMRGRPVENRWIGQRIHSPEIDFCHLARGQGVECEGPIKNVPELEDAICRGLKNIQSGRPYLIDVHVTAGYASPPLSRGT